MLKEFINTNTRRYTQGEGEEEEEQGEGSQLCWGETHARRRRGGPLHSTEGKSEWRNLTHLQPKLEIFDMSKY